MEKSIVKSGGAEAREGGRRGDESWFLVWIRKSESTSLRSDILGKGDPPPRSGGTCARDLGQRSSVCSRFPAAAKGERVHPRAERKRRAPPRRSFKAVE